MYIQTFNVYFSEGFSETDETLMKAKINFTATVVGDHPNIVKFIGAVVDDTGSTLFSASCAKHV